MKKILTTAIFLFAVASTVTYADTPQKVLPLKKDMQSLKTSVLEVSDTPNTLGTLPVAASDDITADTWKSLGNGKFTDIAVARFYDITAGPWQVEIQQSNEHPGYYRMVNPYGSQWSYYQASYRLRSEDTYVTFDCSDPNAVKLVTTNAYNSRYGYTPLNVQLDADDGEFALLDYGGPNGKYGTLSDGNIVIPASNLRIYLKNTGNFYDAVSDLKVSLPDAQDNSIAIAVDNYCYTDNKIPYKVTVGSNVKNVKLCVVSGKRDASTENKNYALQNGTATVAGDYVLDAAADNTLPDGWATLIGVTYDANGNLLEGAVAHFFVTKHVDSEWTDLGTTDFTDDTYAYVFLGTSEVPAAKKVQILQNVADPTTFRLVNAFATSTVSGFDAATMYDGAKSAHNHYTDIQIVSDDNVVIPERPMGLTISGSRLSLSNNQAGKLSGRTVSFPAQGLLVSDGSIYCLANYAGKFSLFIPRYDVTVSVAEGDQAVAGAKVTIGNATATTGSDGTAVVSVYGLSGTVTVTAVNAAGTLMGTSTFDVVADNYDYTVALTLTVETAINKVTVDTPDANAPVYDLNGRRVSNPAQQGIYIKGGKKVVF
jgi:hypothetical protein